MQAIRIAVISDLHTGTDARGADLCPPGEVTFKQTEPDYLTQFRDFVTAQQLEANYLLIAGDLTKFGSRDECAVAIEAIEQVAAALGVPNGKIIATVGNHDTFWGALDDPAAKDPGSPEWAARYQPIRETPSLASLLEDESSSILATPHFRIFQDAQLIGVSFNSANGDAAWVEKHQGEAAKVDLRALDEALCDIPQEGSQLRLMVVHHHPLLWDEPVPDIADFSALVNAGMMNELLQKHNFDLLVHGHKHFPRFQQLTPGTGKPIAYLCSSSFSKRLESSISHRASNGFHLLEVKGRHEKTDCVRGIVRSWSYLHGRGWDVSRKPIDGIDPHEPFGSYALPAVLKSEIKPLLKAEISTHGYADFDRVCQSNPDLELEFLARDLVLRILSELAEELDCEVKGSFPHDTCLVPRGGA